jgi:thiol-disulfide isomerase/thioredoxin
MKVANSKKTIKFTNLLINHKFKNKINNNYLFLKTNQFRLKSIPNFTFLKYKIMKKIIGVLFLVFATISCTNAQKKTFSKEALSQTLLTEDGNQVAFKKILSKNKGKTVLIEVWASWCGDCVKAMPKIHQLQADNPNVTYVFLSADKTADNWKTGIEKHQLKGNHFMMNDGMKGAFAKAIDLDWIPRYIIINPKGEIVLYRAIETDFEKINEVLKSTK